MRFTPDTIDKLSNDAWVLYNLEPLYRVANIFRTGNGAVVVQILEPALLDDAEDILRVAREFKEVK